MKKIISVYIFAYLLITACQYKNPEVYAIIDEIKHEFAPDKRVALWDINYENDRLTGETNLPHALARLQDELDQRGINIAMEVRLLPDTALAGYEFAVVSNSVANMRGEARHSSELVTQALLGTPLKVLKNTGEWYLVQTPDKYISWVDKGGITLMKENEFDTWNNAEKVIVTALNDYVYSSRQFDEAISDLTAGNVMEKESRLANAFKVRLPDGRSGYVKKEIAANFDEWLAALNPGHQSLVQTARSMLGAPYLWGGTSTKGMDCSGFTKTIFFMNGQIIPRDASQQVREGELVDNEKNWELLQPGDLLFFGTPASNERAERVVHVGMWIGDNQFIHASERVRISSVEAGHPLFDEFNLNRYLRTKRILKTPSENVIPVSQALM